MNLNPKIYPDLLKLIGKTPLIKLNKIASNYKGTFFAKWEAFNPSYFSANLQTLNVFI